MRVLIFDIRILILCRKKCLGIRSLNRNRKATKTFWRSCCIVYRYFIGGGCQEIKKNYLHDNPSFGYIICGQIVHM